MATVILIECDRLSDGLAGRAPAAGLLPLVGRPLLSYAAAAFRQCGDVDQVILAGPTLYEDHSAALDQVDGTVLADGSLGDLFAAILERHGDDHELLFWPTNGPLIEPPMIERFLRGAPLDAVATWAVVREKRLLAAFPDPLEWPVQGFGRESVVFTGLGILRPAAVAKEARLIQRILDSDVHRVEAVMALGMGFAIKLKAGRATLAELAGKVAELLGGPCILHVSSDAELAVRVRTREEYHLVRTRLEGP